MWYAIGVTLVIAGWAFFLAFASIITYTALFPQECYTCGTHRSIIDWGKFRTTGTWLCDRCAKENHYC